MKKRRIIFRVDGGTAIGMGHVVRSAALAGMLKNNFTIVFVVQETAESVLKTIQTVTSEIILLPHTDNYSEDVLNFSKHLNADDIVVADGYNFKTEYQKKIKEKKCKLVCIDDLHAWHHVADAIINHADGIDESSYSAEHYTKFYLGFNYVLLRKTFLESLAVPPKIKDVKNVFISMGAADINNLSQRFTEALLQIKGIEEIHLMLGSINPNLKNIEQLIEKNKKVNIISHFDISAEELKRLLLRCDAAICPASTISLECCAVGIGLVSGHTSENQIGILRGLTKHKATIDFGNINVLSIGVIKSNFEKLIAQPELLNDLINNQKQMIDGKSPQRLLNIFKELANEKLHFRFAEKSDVDLYFNWSNDPLVRSRSYSQNIIKHDDHVKWFKSKLLSEYCFFYIFLNEENIPVGQVRIDKSGNEVVIGISIDEKFRGKYYGAEMLEKASNDYFRKNPDSNITAYIKIENARSYSIFLRVGFGNEEIVTVQGYKSYKLTKKQQLQ